MLEGAKSIGAGAATIASAGAAVGIGNVLSSSIHSVARNPSLAKQSFGYAILGFALTEAIASFAPMMASLISFVFRSQKGKKNQVKHDLLKEIGECCYISKNIYCLSFCCALPSPLLRFTSWIRMNPLPLG
ncbi:ATP synthase subunit 9, mitochondrial [Phoenix dactylifera]|uniref:ATP synthase subunit 9, mitochondrial n=2 Tax=Phoenix dactylifera TaxID=42345 RepID=A0A8B8ZVW3_PHODC|nr:ATP synthase subunit 9, mitochondrial [Phoenix dactylifera]